MIIICKNVFILKDKHSVYMYVATSVFLLVFL